MYEKLYNLSAAPFKSDPDHVFLYEHRHFVQAQTYMSYAFMVAEGFAMVTGCPGVGKTTLVTRLVGRFADQGVKTVNLESARLRGNNLLRVVAENFGIQRPGKGKEEVMQQLGKQLRRWHSEGTRSLLVVDEAQDLSEADFGDLLQLVNMLEAGRPLLQIFLVGTPGLRDLLSTAPMEELRRRIVAETELEALAEDEVQPYVLHRLQAAGWQEDPILDEAIYPLLYKFGQGVPARINLVCTRLLELAGAQDKHEISAAEVQAAIESLESDGLAGPAAAGAGADAEPDAGRELSPAPFAATGEESEETLADSEETVSFAAFSAAPGDLTGAAELDTGQDWGVHVHSAGESESPHHNAPRPGSATRARATRAKRRKGGSGWYLAVLVLLLLWVAWLRGYIDTTAIGSFATRVSETSSSPKGDTAQAPSQGEQEAGGASAREGAAITPAADPVTAPAQVGITTGGSGPVPEFDPAPAGAAVAAPELATGPGETAAGQAGDRAASPAQASQASTLAGNQAETTGGLDCSLKYRIAFDNDSSRLSEAARELLNAVASDCLGTATNKVLLTGYTDTWGGWDYNLRLSRQRAEAAAEYLIAQGVNPESVYAEGLGEYGMDQAQAGAEANADDRRIVLVAIIAMESAP